jgi:hypothetical protein
LEDVVAVSLHNGKSAGFIEGRMRGGGHGAAR